MGRSRIEIKPRIVTIIDTTAAKIGRSIKKWDSRIGIPAFWGLA
jgi:hypothetical protein